jgi:hypothetical protein
LFLDVSTDVAEQRWRSAFQRSRYVVVTHRRPTRKSGSQTGPKAPFGNPEINSNFALISANRRCGSCSLKARRHHRLATLLAVLKTNDLTLILVQNREKKSSSELLFFAIVAILSPPTPVNTIHPVAHHNAKST